MSVLFFFFFFGIAYVFVSDPCTRFGHVLGAWPARCTVIDRFLLSEVLDLVSEEGSILVAGARPKTANSASLANVVQKNM